MNGYQRLRAFDEASKLRDAAANIKAALETVELATPYLPPEPIWADRSARLKRELAYLAVRMVEDWLELSRVFDASEREAAPEREGESDESLPF